MPTSGIVNRAQAQPRVRTFAHPLYCLVETVAYHATTDDMPSALTVDVNEVSSACG